MNLPRSKRRPRRPKKVELHLNVEKQWVVYILRCGNGNLYTGITNDIVRRINAHAAGRGAKYTRMFSVSRLVYQEPQADRSSALKREHEIKSWSKARKLALLQK